MACEQQLRKSQGTNILPNEVTTEQQSLIVVKKLLAIAVSCITYLRGLFPEKAYGSKYIEEQKVMILREERSCPGSSQIVQWMHGCFDALQKKYLRLVVLSIYTDPENPQKVTECYQFKIQYTEKGPQMEFESRNNNNVTKMACGNVKKASILLVRKLYMLMQNLGPLPDSVCLNMKLSYYDEVTPQDYEPPGFKEGDSDSMMFEKEPVNLTMGEVVTPFHTLKVDVITERERLEQVGEDESVCKAERAALKMEADQQATTSNSQPNKPCRLPVLKDRKAYHNKADFSEVQVSSQEDVKTREVKLDSSHLPQIDNLVMKTSDLGVTIKRTRSGRVIKSMVGKTDTTVCSTTKNTPIPQMNEQTSPCEAEMEQSRDCKRMPKKQAIKIDSFPDSLPLRKIYYVV
ncbi:HORMA domain-containing protein 1 [Conger conger]|uniref:HORMA domain-containing protein 1 n=1 Tax=Conger conger TaxID=82655 RepID=UPI002A5A6EF5|nr:HORMA domain-containing protein 1 [Conger conger]